MGLNVASLILECFMLSTDNNFTEKFCKCMHSDPTTVVEHVSVYSQFFPLSYFMSWHYFELRDHDKPNLTVDRKRKLFPWTKVNGAPKICNSVFQKDGAIYATNTAMISTSQVL